MSRNTLIASLAGAVALGLSAFSAQAAQVPMDPGAVNSGAASLIEKANYRHHRHHHHHHRWHRWDRWHHWYHHHHRRHHHHHHHRRHNHW
jgi:hypothetical protein